MRKWRQRLKSLVLCLALAPVILLFQNCSKLESFEQAIANGEVSDPSTDPGSSPTPTPTPVTGFTWPNASTTGVPAGVTLSNYTGPMTISVAGTVIDSKIITGTLVINAANVVIKNSRISFSGWWGVDAETAVNPTIQDCDIIGPGYSAENNAAILGSGNFLRNDIAKVQNGIVLTSGSSVVKGNYIHDLESAGSDPHYDGLSIQGGQNGVLVEDNTILARDTSAIFLNNDFGAVSNVTINHNFLGGSPGYNIYIYGNGAGTTGVVFTNNSLARGGYGYYSIEATSPVMSGNIELPAGTMPW